MKSTGCENVSIDPLLKCAVLFTFMNTHVPEKVKVNINLVPTYTMNAGLYQKVVYTLRFQDVKTPCAVR